MNKPEMVELRQRLIMGDPPYSVDPIGALRRTSGVAGLHELERRGDHDANAASVRMAISSMVALIDHMLERMRG